MNVTANKQQGFTLIELMIVVAIIGILASIAIPAYQDYVVRSKWGKAMTHISALKLAIGECLNDNAGNTTNCNDFGAAELGKYGITAAPSSDGDFSSISIVSSNAAIRITGSSALAMCVFDLVPFIESAAGNITWMASAQSPGTGGVGIEKCRTYIKDAK